MPLQPGIDSGRIFIFTTVAGADEVARRRLFLAMLGVFGAWGAAAEETGTLLPEVEVTADQDLPLSVSTTTLNDAEIAPKRARTSDTASLLTDIPGVSVYGAGGVSSLPAIRGLADDRLRTKVDGMDLVAACPNHMNAPLSYIDPTAVENVRVYPGVTPVSVGGDSIGGSILVQSAAPSFADPGGRLAKGEAGAFYRSNGDSWGGNLSGTYATESVSLNYTGAYTQSDNYRAGGDFKDYIFTGREGHTLDPGRGGLHRLPGQQPGDQARLDERWPPGGLHVRLPAHPVRGLSESTHGYDGQPQRPVQSGLHRRPELGHAEGAGLLRANPA